MPQHQAIFQSSAVVCAWIVALTMFLAIPAFSQPKPGASEKSDQQAPETRKPADKKGAPPKQQKPQTPEGPPTPTMEEGLSGTIDLLNQEGEQAILEVWCDYDSDQAQAIHRYVEAYFKEQLQREKFQKAKDAYDAQNKFTQALRNLRDAAPDASTKAALDGQAKGSQAAADSAKQAMDQEAKAHAETRKEEDAARDKIPPGLKDQADQILKRTLEKHKNKQTDKTPQERVEEDELSAKPSDKCPPKTATGVGSSTLPTSAEQGAMASTSSGLSEAQPVNVAFTGTYSYILKGGSRETATATISQQMKPRIAVTLSGKDENPESWRKDIAIGYKWNSFDERFSFVGAANGDDTYSAVGQLTRQDLRGNQSLYTGLVIDAGLFDSKRPFNYFGKQRIRIPEFPTAIPEIPSGGVPTLNITPGFYGVPTGNLVIDNRVPYIKRFAPGTNVQKISQDLERGGFSGLDSWTAWQNPYGPPMYVYRLNDAGHVDRWRAITGSRTDLFEANEDRSAAPAPSLNPTHWPATHAEAVPQLSITLEEAVP